MERWKRDLEELLAGPFAGHGGVTLLARKMQISRQTVYQWRSDRRAPNFSNRLALRSLVAAYAGPWSD